MNRVTAFVLITVPATQSGGVVAKLTSEYADFVSEAAAVYGEADVIAKIEAASVDQLHDVVMEKIQGLPHVQVTRTFIIIPHLHSYGNPTRE